MRLPLAQSVVAIAVIMGSVPPAAADDTAQIPPSWLGNWAIGGKCASGADLLTITAGTAGFGAGSPDPVYFSPVDGSFGKGAILWKEEGVVSNIEYLDEKDAMVFRAEGFGGGGPQTLYLRCAATEATASPAREHRCGWLANLTPNDLWLVDRDKTWTITAQLAGGDDAKGVEKVPDFVKKDFVTTQGDYGYGCACLDVTTELASERITEVFGGKILPIRQCSKDKSLPALSKW